MNKPEIGTLSSNEVTILERKVKEFLTCIKVILGVGASYPGGRLPHIYPIAQGVYQYGQQCWINAVNCIKISVQTDLCQWA